MTASPMIAALIKAQQGFKPIIKDNTANAGKFSYRYADLGTVLEAVLPALQSNGFALVQPVGVSQLGEPIVRTTLLHESGERIESEYPVRVADPTDPQKVGGGVTFARRYSLIALLGLATEDDDANHARTPAPPRAVSRPTPIQQDNVLFEPKEVVDAWMARITAANNAPPDQAKDALNALYKDAFSERSQEKIEMLIEHLTDHNAANTIASNAETKGLLSALAFDLMMARTEKRKAEQAQEQSA